MLALVQNPIKRFRKKIKDIPAVESEADRENELLLSEFDLLESKAEAEDLSVGSVELIRTKDVKSQVAALMNSVPFGAALHIEITPPVNEGPVREVTRIFMMKRRDKDVPEDKVTTYFQIGLEIGSNDHEKVQSAVIFNEIVGKDVRKETNLSLDPETGLLDGTSTLHKDGKKRTEHLDQKACDKGLVEAAETADRPVIEVVDHVTVEFDQIDRRQHGKRAVATEALKAALKSIDENRAAAG